MNKHLLLILLGFGSFGVFSQTNINEFEFALTCKVQDQIVFGIEDGKTQRFGGYQNGLEIGDSFQITFKMKEDDNFFNLNIDSTGIRAYANFQSKYVNKITSYGFVDYLNNQVGSISPNSISIRYLFGNVHLNRYFKNDWQLMYATPPTVQSTHMLTANCMNMPKQFDKVISIIESVAGELLD